VAIGVTGECEVKKKECGGMGKRKGKMKLIWVAAYIRRLTEEYRRAVPTTLRPIYSLVMSHH
jgi:hypothetical protein